MRVAVFGLGYVGCVSAACLARDNHHVVGIDTVKSKVDDVNGGIPTVAERGLAPVFRDVYEAGRVHAVSVEEFDLEGVDASVICVGTPPGKDGGLDGQNVFRAAETIGAQLGKVDGFHPVFIRSTVMPGTVEQVAGILSEMSGKTGRLLCCSRCASQGRLPSAMSWPSRRGRRLWGGRRRAPNRLKGWRR